jgi:hypothetical protein
MKNRDFSSLLMSATQPARIHTYRNASIFDKSHEPSEIEVGIASFGNRNLDENSMKNLIATQSGEKP